MSASFCTLVSRQTPHPASVLPDSHFSARLSWRVARYHRVTDFSLMNAAQKRCCSRMRTTVCPTGTRTTETRKVTCGFHSVQQPRKRKPPKHFSRCRVHSQEGQTRFPHLYPSRSSARVVPLYQTLLYCPTRRPVDCWIALRP